MEGTMSQGTRVLALASTFLLAGTIAAMRPSGTARSESGARVAPANNTAINYPAFPTTNGGPTPYPSLTAGPYIVAATARPTAVTGGTADVLLVFNEGIDVPSVDVSPSGSDGTGNTDIRPYGFTFTGVTVSANTIALTGAAGAEAGDRVRLASIQALAGSDG
jgi:hypothetical protein